MDFGLVDDDVFRWKVMLEGPEDTLFEGGFFPCSLTFPPDYPNSPPEMTFNTPGFWHPNVYPTGKVCISILHAPTEDQYNTQEPVSEKWRPILGIEQVLLSVVSMLSEPNISSPANVEAAKMYRDDPDAYKRRIKEVVRRSQDAL